MFRWQRYDRPARRRTKGLFMVLDASTLRRLGGRMVDVLATRLLGLPPATARYTVTRKIPIPMRDGVDLAADLYRPSGDAAGTVLARGPYGRGPGMALTLARIFAARGYQVLFVSSRGTFGSGGEFDPMRTEAVDGQDVVAWLREQPWFTGTFATVGGSYLGHTQWALLADPPPELAAAVIGVGPHDFSRHLWGTGAFNLDLVFWSEMIAHQEDGSMIGGLIRNGTVRRRLRPVLDGLPLADTADAHFAGRAPWFRYRATHPDLTDPYWAPMQHGGALDHAEVPVLLMSGWHDLFLGQTIEQYTRLHERGVDVALTVGPWTHLDFAGKGAPLTGQESLDWLDEHLAHRTRRRRRAPVRIFVTGAGEWRALSAWPQDTAPHTLHLRSGGGLTVAAPDSAGKSSGKPSVFIFDPADPTPTVGGPLLSGGGSVDDRRLAARPDVLTFTGEPLDRDLEVLGKPRVELAHTTDNPHADLFVRISEVDPRGRSRNVTETYLRLDPDRDPGPVTLDLRDTAHRFRAGNRVRLLVAGGSHPQYARNLGTGENPGTGTELRTTRHTVGHGEGGVSRLVLPVAT
jgi:putative CocE/NonD family hydrolase